MKIPRSPYDRSEMLMGLCFVGGTLYGYWQSGDRLQTVFRRIMTSEGM